ncbi:MAG: Lrp/AsnC family transcriptional regulator [Nitratireductor sp.]|nr:Lrp/AsnC family transcriptional regulator [Nitratireductor sp.]
MDKLDIRILSALQADGSLTQAQLAEITNSTPSTCLRRVHRLKQAGYLTRCVYLTDPKMLERGVKAFITVVTKDQGRHDFMAFIERIAQEPSINMAYGTTGDVDAIVSGNFTSLEEYREVCERLFDTDPFVERYTTLFAVQALKEKTAIATDELERRIVVKKNLKRRK